MIIKKTKYVVASKSFPLKFYNWGGYESEGIEEFMADSKEDAEYVLSNFDDPDLYQILPVEITYSL